MGRITVRIDDAVLARVRAAAEETGGSLGGYVSSVLDAASRPPVPAASPRAGRRPPAILLDAARKRAGRGTSLTTIVGDGW